MLITSCLFTLPGVLIGFYSSRLLGKKMLFMGDLLQNRREIRHLSYYTCFGSYSIVVGKAGFYNVISLSMVG